MNFLMLGWNSMVFFILVEIKQSPPLVLDVTVRQSSVCFSFVSSAMVFPAGPRPRSCEARVPCGMSTPGGNYQAVPRPTEALEVAPQHKTGARVPPAWTGSQHSIQALRKGNASKMKKVLGPRCCIDVTWSLAIGFFWGHPCCGYNFCSYLLPWLQQILGFDVTSVTQ